MLNITGVAVNYITKFTLVSDREIYHTAWIDAPFNHGLLLAM